MKRKLVAWTASLALLALASPASAVAPFQIDDFQDTTTQSWEGEAGTSTPPQNVGSGQGGMDDRYLEVRASAPSGPGSTLFAFSGSLDAGNPTSPSQWSGSYLAAGIYAVEMDVVNNGGTALDLRIGVDGPGGAFVSDEAVELLTTSGWRTVRFGVLPTDLTPAQGNSSPDVIATLDAVTQLRVVHATTASFDGSAVNGELGVDNITAAAGVAFTARLDPEQAGTDEGAMPGTGQGSASFVYDPRAGTLEYHVTIGGLSGTESSARLRGPAGAGESGSIVYDLPTGATKSGRITLGNPVALGRDYAVPQQVVDLVNGLWYVNVPTSTFADGEIRGQLNRVRTYTSALDPDQIVGDGGTGMGEGFFALDTSANVLHYDVAFSGLSGDEGTGSDLRGPAQPGTTAAEIYNLPIANPKVGAIELENPFLRNYPVEDQIDDLDAGLWYVLIATATKPLGEIRGQIDPTELFVSAIDAAQSGGGERMGEGSGVVWFDTTNQLLFYDFAFGGLSSAQTAAHLHGPAAPGASAGIVYDVGVGSPNSGTIELTTPVFGARSYAVDDQIDDLRDDLWYVNIHTQDFSGGEIRGQLLLVPEPASRLLALAALVTTGALGAGRASRVRGLVARRGAR